MKTRLWFGCGALLVLAAAGCGGGAKSLTEDEFCVDWAQNECAKVAPNCVFDETKCETQRNTACQSFKAAAKASSSMRVYQPDNATACLNKIKSVYGKDKIMASDLDDLNEVCARVFQGAAKANEACTVDYDCEKSLICDKGKDVAICATQKKVSTDANCGNPGEVCGTGQYCTKPMAVYVCKDRAKFETACSGTNPCEEKYRCTGGTCQNRLPDGMACTSNADCVNEFCDPYSRNCKQFLNFAEGSTSCNGFIGIAPAAADAGTTD